NVPNPTLPPTPWFARLRLSGKLLALGGLAGVLAAFLPLISVSVEVLGVSSVHKTEMVVEDWRGKVGLVGYLAALFLTFLLYPPHGPPQKALCWLGVAAGLLVAGLAVWLLVEAPNARAAVQVMGLASAKKTVGAGAFLNVLAGAVVAGGGF